MRKVFTTVALFLLFLTLYAGEFRIVATTDLHGNLRNLAALAPAIRQAKGDIIVDAGDLTGGNLLAELDGGRSMIQALNMLNYHFRVPGNHDFDVPFNDFVRLLRNFKGTTLGADWKWGSESGVLCKVVHKGKFQVGVIGMTESALDRRHLPVKGAPVTVPWEKVMASALKELRKAKVNCIVLIWHQGINPSRFSAQQITRFFPETDLVIGGHTHQENAGLRNKRTLFVQPGAHGTSAALVKIFFNDKTLKVERMESALLRGEIQKSAPDLVALNKRAVKPFYKTIYRKICRKGDLNSRNFPGLGAYAICCAGKTRSAVFVANTPDPSVAQGNLFKDLFRLMPYRNTLCTVELTREELRHLLDDLERNNRKFKRIMGVYGFRWSPGSRHRKGVLEAPEKISVTVNSYLMTASPVLKKILPDTKRWKALHIVERDAVQHYLEGRLHRKP